MKRPEVAFDNFEEVYEFYKHYEPRPATARFLYGAMGKAFHPNVSYVGEAEAQIEDMLESGRTLVLASNHVSAIDPCVIAAMPARESVLKPIVGNSFIPSKAVLFKPAPLRYAVDGLGAVPLFREGREIPADTKASKTRAVSGFIKMCVDRLDQGQHMAIFPEGTRGADPTQLQEVKSGLGSMICRVKKVAQPAIVPMAIHYDSDSLRDRRAPVVVIGEPSTDLFAKSAEVTEWTQEHLQVCLDQVLEVV